MFVKELEGIFILQDIPQEEGITSILQGWEPPNQSHLLKHIAVRSVSSVRGELLELLIGGIDLRSNTWPILFMVAAHVTLASAVVTTVL